MKRQAIDVFNTVKHYIHGIDVSYHQGAIDWTKVTRECYFAIIRTGDGKDLDSNFTKNWKGAHQVGLLTGSYHYFRADRDGKTQAQMVIDAIDRAGGMGVFDLPPALDLEAGVSKNLPDGVLGGTSDLPLGLIVDECLEFLHHIEDQMKMIPIMYTGQAFHYWLSQDPTKTDIANQFAKYPLWVPSYTNQPLMPVNTKGEGFPWKTWFLWQFTAEMQVSGISGNCDGSTFRGDLAALKLFSQNLRHTPPAVPAPFVSQTASNIARAEELLKKFESTLEELKSIISDLK